MKNHIIHTHEPVWQRRGTEPWMIRQKNVKLLRQPVDTLCPQPSAGSAMQEQERLARAGFKNTHPVIPGHNRAFVGGSHERPPLALVSRLRTVWQGRPRWRQRQNRVTIAKKSKRALLAAITPRRRV